VGGAVGMVLVQVPVHGGGVPADGARRGRA
jgi:hypothetical protein